MFNRIRHITVYGKGRFINVFIVGLGWNVKQICPPTTHLCIRNTYPKYSILDNWTTRQLINLFRIQLLGYIVEFAHVSIVTLSRTHFQVANILFCGALHRRRLRQQPIDIYIHVHIIYGNRYMRPSFQRKVRDFDDRVFVKRRLWR